MKGVFVVVPEIGTFMLGLGIMFCFSTATTYLIDTVPGRSSSTVALNNLVRSILSCIATIVAKPPIDALGNGILFSLVAGIALASCACI
jgi:hypothetical protein